MKTAVLTTSGFQIQHTQVPKFGENELLIQTHSSGVCSGDLFVYQNRQTMAESHSLLGHEGSGTVVQMGHKVSGFAIGDVVTSFSLPVYADYFVSAPEKLVKVPPGIEPTYALGEAIACCVHAGNRFGIQPGDKVAVIGCGFMGLVCLQLAHYQGAGFICAIDLIAERLTLAQQFGAAAVYDPTQSAAEKILDRHGPFDVVIEAAGVQKAIDLSTELVGQHGRMILIGYHQSNDGIRSINMQQWNYKGIDVINGHVRRHDEKLAAMQAGMELMAQGHLDTKPLVTAFELADIEAAFQALDTRKPGLLKAVIMVNDQLNNKLIP